ncbi:uncharacterized protein LOC125214043 [Salvia hispanica]|uniref:uncharacterized protein LOC125214043 n=1 Tax=Salvia hispanica TaxID=49212 RepID=UPI002009C689|nr:uncharacterized protein LOC125214043 [Salvia hispanica]
MNVVEETYWSSNLSPGGKAGHDDHEVCPSNCPSSPDGKKSVLSKVRDTAKKLRYSLSSRRRNGIDFHEPDHSQSPDLSHNKYSRSQSHNYSRGQSHALNQSLSHNYSRGQSHALNQSLSHNYSRSQSHGVNHSLSHNYSQGQSHDLSRNNSHVPNYNHSQSRNQSYGLSHDRDNITPSWGATMEDDCDHEDDYDPEYLGAPMYESEAAPESLKETARQHPRAEPVVSNSHRAPNMNHEAAMLGTDQPASPNPIADKTRAVVEKLATACALSAGSGKNKNNNNTSTTQAVANKLAPAYAAVSDATHNTYTAVSDATHNINANTISNTTHAVADKLAPAYTAVSDATHTGASMITNTSHAVADKLGPACTVVSDATQQIASKIASIAVASPGAKPSQEAKAELVSEDAGNVKQCASGSPQTYDKGVSVKEYFLSKLEPGDDERALSQAITEAISPRKSTGETGVVDLVKEAVSSFFRQEEASHLTETSAGLITNAPVSSEVETVAALNASNSPTEVQLKRAASIKAGTPTSLSSPVALGTSAAKANSQLNRIATIHTERPSIAKASPQLNRAASVHVCSTKVFTNSANNSPIATASSNAHEVYEEENKGRILQTN